MNKQTQNKLYRETDGHRDILVCLSLVRQQIRPWELLTYFEVLHMDSNDSFLNIGHILSSQLLTVVFCIIPALFFYVITSDVIISCLSE